jgi:hypothetical protein
MSFNVHEELEELPLTEEELEEMRRNGVLVTMKESLPPVLGPMSSIPVSMVGRGGNLPPMRCTDGEGGDMVGE